MTANNGIIPLQVKWNKNEAYDISININIDNVVSLKTQLESLTGIPVGRMKLMPKSKGESEWWKDGRKVENDTASVQRVSRIRSFKYFSVAQEIREPHKNVRMTMTEAALIIFASCHLVL